jgi:hypothetical protein
VPPTYFPPDEVTFCVLAVKLGLEVDAGFQAIFYGSTMSISKKVIYTCDRCMMEMTVSKDDLPENWIRMFLPEKERIDLCGRCHKEFNEWLDNAVIDENDA